MAAGDTAHYLFHGGHLWNTEFEVMATYNTASENINALEAANIPEPCDLGHCSVGPCWYRYGPPVATERLINAFAATT